MLSWKQRTNIGKLTWLVLFAIGALPIWLLIHNYFWDGILTAIWGSFVYLIVPLILKDLRIWR